MDNWYRYIQGRIAHLCLRPCHRRISPLFFPKKPWRQVLLAVEQNWWRHSHPISEYCIDDYEDCAKQRILCGMQFSDALEQAIETVPEDDNPDTWPIDEFYLSWFAGRAKILLTELANFSRLSSGFE